MAKKKRADGEGSIRKRPNGTWEARLSIPGQYKTKSFYGKTQAEVRRKRAEAEKALEAGHSLDSQKQTVGEYLEGWLEGPLKTSVAPKTYADYAWICRKYLIPEIGRHKLAKLTAEDLDRLYARKTDSGLGARTVGYIHSTIRVALQRAVKKRLIPYNVARDAEPPPRGPKKERTTLSLEQVADFFKAAAEARRKRAEAEKALEAGHSLDSQKQTVGEYLEGWLEGPLKTSVAPKTYADYSWICRKYLIPEIGRYKLAKLTAEDLDRLYARKTDSGLGARTVGYIHSTIRVALQRAVKKRLIPYNIARDAEPPPRGPKKERTTLSLEQVVDFFKAAAEAESRFEALFIVAVLAGPRPGELLGLKWHDLVLPNEPEVPGEARIRRAVSVVWGKPYLRDTTKTGKGRPIHLLPEAVQALKAHRLRYLEERLRFAEVWNAAWQAEPRHEDLVFPSLGGGPMDRDNLAARHFKPLLKRAGLPDIRLYDLRHTFATLWLESGEHPKILQEILGHSRISVTLDTYSHVIPHMQREAMGRFGKMFSQPS